MAVGAVRKPVVANLRIALRDERLAYTTTLEPADQKLRLPLAAAVTARRVDVNDPNLRGGARADLPGYSIA